MQSLAYVLPDFRSFSTVDYVAYGFNIPMNQLAQDLTVVPGVRGRAVRHRLLLPADARGGQMTERTSFYRKIAYGVAIVVLCFRASCWLSAPATTTREGGKLAQLRNEYRLGAGESSATSTRPAKRSSWRRSACAASP